MSDATSLRKCPICQDDYLEEKRMITIGDRFWCKRCGIYDLDPVVPIRGDNFDKVRHLVSAWIRERQGMPSPPVVAKDMNIYDPKWPLQYEHMGFPRTVTEKLDRLLLVFGEMARDDPKKTLNLGDPSLISLIAARDRTELNGLIELLRELGYFGEPFSIPPDTRLRAEGWRHIDELSKSTAIGDSAFVAMWFSDSTKEYRAAVTVALQKCNYKPIIIDQENFNGFIMDQVVASIRQARFVIADFTCGPEVDCGSGQKIKDGVRGGVYWEAGFAYGLNKPVIHTCEKTPESMSRVHFDVDQYRTIYWTPDMLGGHIRDLRVNLANPNFAEQLALHILSTVGEGSYID